MNRKMEPIIVGAVFIAVWTGAFFYGMDYSKRIESEKREKIDQSRHSHFILKPADFLTFRGPVVEGTWEKKECFESHSQLELAIENEMNLRFPKEEGEFLYRLEKKP